MRKSKLVLCSMALAALALPAAAQTDAVVGKGPGVAGAAQMTSVTATITAIDPATREITLKGDQGHDVTVVAGPDVRNFAQMQVGDQVSVDYLQALTLELKKGGGAPVARTEQPGSVAAQPGDKPAGAVGRTVTVVADVTAVDPATQTVTLKGPQQTVDLKVSDLDQFNAIKVGDQVEATYTEALAVAVEAAKK